jgi:glycosyltransferase involved in cell wall biosynthesis
MKVPSLTLTRSELAARIRSGDRLRGMQSAVIHSEIPLSAVPFKDVFDLWLAGFGPSECYWRDDDQSYVIRPPWTRSVFNIGRDVLAWPKLYWSHVQSVRRLRRLTDMDPKFQAPPRQVLFLRSDHWFGIRTGGSVTHLNGVANSLRRHHLNTTIVSSDYIPGIGDERDFIIHRPDPGIGRNLPGFNELQYSEQLYRFCGSLWQNVRPDFIYQRYSLGNYTGPALRATFNVPYVCEFNGPLVWVARHWERRTSIHDKLLSAIELLNVLSADLVVVVSEPLRELLRNQGVRDERILVNPNGVDLQAFSFSSDTREIRRQYALGDAIVIGFIGTFGPWHGGEVLAHAFARLEQKMQGPFDIRLFMIGDGPGRDQAKAILTNVPQHKVIFTGAVPAVDAPKHLLACDILVAPHIPNPDGSKFFGSPTKLFEYMASGRAIVASALGQMREILEDERTALLVPPASVDDLATAIERLVEHPDLRARLGRQARQVVADRYTWQHHTDRILIRLHQLVGAGIHTCDATR